MKKEKIDGLFDHLIEEYFQEGELPLKKLISYVEIRLIVSSLERSKGNQREAARILGVGYTTLHEKMNRYNIGFHNVLVFNGKNGS
jgi:DNA-binding NtrC family response regulator